MPDIDVAHIRQLDGGLLLVFHELSMTRSATLTAERLGLTQSGVSHALGRLRVLFADELFLRRPHGFAPTPRALELAPCVASMLDLAQGALAGARAFDPAVSRRQFRIGAPDFLTALMSGALMRAVKSEAPHVSVAFRHALGGAALEEVRRGELDFALGRLRKPAPPLKRLRLLKDVYVVAGRRGHPTLRTKLTRERFERLEQVIVAPPGGGSSSAAQSRAFAAAPHFIAAFSIVSQTDAVVIAPRRLAETYARALGLTFAEAPAPRPQLEAFLVYREGAAPDPALAWMSRLLQSAAG